MLFPETIYEKDLPTDSQNRRMVLSLTHNRCDAAVWDDNVAGSLRIVSTDHISKGNNGQWIGLEDFLYDNPGLLAPMSQTKFLVATEDVVIMPGVMMSEDAVQFLRASVAIGQGLDETHYNDIWYNCCNTNVGILVQSKLARFISRSFMPVEIKWYASVITEYWQRIIYDNKKEYHRCFFQAFTVISPDSLITTIVVDRDGNLVAATSRKGATVSDKSYYILSLLDSLTSSMNEDVNLLIFGPPQESVALKEKLSGWIDVKLHTYITGKPSIIDSTQLHLIAPELLLAIETF